MLFTFYYLLNPRSAEEKTRKFRALITTEHLRVSWGKPVDNPFLRFLRWCGSPKLDVRVCTYLPDERNDFSKNYMHCQKNAVKPWHLKYWTDYDPSFGIEGKNKSSESRDSGGIFSEDSSLTRFSGTKPALCYIMFADSIEKYKKTKKIILDYPGGGYVSMSPPCHDDYLSQWAKTTGAIIVSVDYGKAPEHPYPYAIDQCFEVYKSLVKSNGKCIGLELSDDEKIEIVIVGDSAGANISASVMFRILESEEEMPLPKGIIFVYGLFDFDIRSWMTVKEMDLVTGVATVAKKNAIFKGEDGGVDILEPKNHLNHVSPLELDNKSVSRRSTLWSKDTRKIADKIRYVKEDINPEEYSPSESDYRDSESDSRSESENEGDDDDESEGDDDGESEDKGEFKRRGGAGYHKKRISEDISKIGDQDQINHANMAHPINDIFQSSARRPQSQHSKKSRDENHRQTLDADSNNISNSYRLTMTSKFVYFNDMILSPEMMRAMALLYIGPNPSPNFQKDYYFSPIVAPDELLARFPDTYFMCGEKDPLVDDTVIFAGRIREAKAKVRAQVIEKQLMTQNAGVESKTQPEKANSSATSTTKAAAEDLDLKKNTASEQPPSFEEGSVAENDSRDFHRFEKASTYTSDTSSSHHNIKDSNNVLLNIEGRIHPDRKRIYRSVVNFQNHKEIDKQRWEGKRKAQSRDRLNKDIMYTDDPELMRSQFYIGDSSSNPTSAEVSDSDSGYSPRGSKSSREMFLKSLKMTKFDGRNNEKSGEMEFVRLSKYALEEENMLNKQYRQDTKEGNISGAKDKGLWDLNLVNYDDTAAPLSRVTSRASLLHEPTSTSVSGFPPIMPTADLDTAALLAEKSEFSPVLTNHYVREVNIKNMEQICSTPIKVKLLEGMSHGFMQIGSIFADAQAATNNLCDWIMELLDNDGHIDNYNRRRGYYNMYCSSSRANSSYDLYSVYGSEVSLSDHDYNDDIPSNKSENFFSARKVNDNGHSSPKKIAAFSALQNVNPQSALNPLQGIVTNIKHEFAKSLGLLDHPTPSVSTPNTPVPEDSLPKYTRQSHDTENHSSISSSSVSSASSTSPTGKSSHEKDNDISNTSSHATDSKSL
ncbi:Hormone-sensitive lipase, partial [Zancudomyces culisetae]